MLKYILVAAALLAPALAYSASPGTNLSVQIVPAATPAPPPSPTPPPPPAGAAAAGYTTLALNIDFTGATTSSYNGNTFNAQSLSAWLDCAGASNPVFWVNGFSSSAPPCSAYNVINDNGTTVLDMTYLPSYWPNSLTTSIQTVNPSNNSSQHNFPQGVYYEVTFKLSNQTVNNSCSSGVGNNPLCLFGTVFTWVFGNGSTAPMEWDIVETYSNGAAINGAIDHTSNAGYNMGPNYYGGSGDLTNYHTYANRVTTDGNNNWEGCSYLDNSFLGCSGSSFSGDQKTQRNIISANIGAWQGNTNVLTQQDMYIEHIRVWSCSSWLTSQCNGTLLTSSP